MEKKWWESSVDAGKLAMRIKGALVAGTSVVLPALLLFGVQIDQEGANTLIEAISEAVQAVGTLVGIGISVYGYIRRKK